MKKIVLLLGLLFLSVNAAAIAGTIDTEQFGHHYFNVWKATQSPQATKSDIQRYLSLLKDDVGHQHLPYDPDATREADGKQRMLEGMLYYLGTHTEYTATLATVVVGYQVVVIKYNTQLAGKHPQTGELMRLSYDTVEVLEIEDGKVAVIRKYSE
ncbi:nuclear transport factor 2 family protein [uncultured Paraglaciecola sp.]|uniref:nuclear transport factor 2 family protein n=1 Tax=uncultured Paraglaciecola sp. TaxID=1765024 RepID=UPI0030D7A406|tara:strand:+ start:179429 stop:179893 length:465 start_codon:yes stop_codon:yes gene_type:complete